MCCPTSSGRLARTWPFTLPRRISASGTTHGSANLDDQRVPVLFLGAGIKPGKYQEPATPADVAPTLAVISGLTMKTEGHPLSCVK